MDQRTPPKDAIDFQRLFEACPGLYLVLAPDLTIAAVTDAYLAATMTRREEILGRGIFEVFPDNPADKNATGVSNLRASLNRVLAQGGTDAMAVQKYDIRRPDTQGGGFEERYWSPVNSAVNGPEGKLSHIIHRVEDVTDFVRLKRQGQEQHRVAEELKTRTVQMEAEIFQRAQQLQEANTRVRQFNEELERRVQERTADLHRTEEKLRHAQKMEAVGRLTGGIAHDFNNMLAVVLSYTAMVLDALGPTNPHRADLEQVRSAGERAASLTRQLLAFSRQQVIQLKVLDLNAIISATENMLRRLIGENIEFKTRLDPHASAVRADESQVEQVVANLVVNARDAMPSGGRVLIETSNVTLDEDYAREQPGVTPGPYVLMSVTDNGVGMDAQTRARVFEPFFTTKERGKGTGLGLATVYGIVKACGGHIWVYSELGHGTVFKVYFPAASAETAPAQKSYSAILDQPGNETLLLVEDELLVREATKAVLRRRGYTVLDAVNGRDALQVIRTHGGVIHLMITDLIMPGITGRELATQVSQARPGIKTIYMSGYTDHTFGEGALDPDVVFIQKPFVPDTLLRTVRQTLDSNTAGKP